MFSAKYIKDEIIQNNNLQVFYSKTSKEYKHNSLRPMKNL